ncbi:MAG TPA: WYL domain-containing protein [Chitinophagaceae bacterium]|nr:WYL domain-containing protein [Chitinophagaceae bacterium]
MPDNKAFLTRIDIINDCFQNAKGKKWTKNDLLERVNEILYERHGKSVSSKTLFNDLDYLKNEKHAPIKKERSGTTNYFYYSENFELHKTDLSGEEIEYLKDALVILKKVRNFKVVKDLGQVVDKLQHTIHLATPDNTDIIHFEHHTVSEGADYVDELFEAIKSKSSLRVSYQPFLSPLPNEFLFHPYLLKQFRNRWFVYGRKENESRPTNLALDRIKKIRNSTAVFVENDMFQPDILFKHVIGVTLPYDGEPCQITIKANAHQANYIRTKPIHNSQKIIKFHKDQSITLTINVIRNYELTSTLLSYGADIEVISPEILRTELKHIFDTASSMYSHDTIAT